MADDSLLPDFKRSLSYLPRRWAGNSHVPFRALSGRMNDSARLETRPFFSLSIDAHDAPPTMFDDEDDG